MRHYTIFHSEASMGWGGQEIRIITESVGMMERGHRVFLVCQPGSIISTRAHEHGIETFVMRLGGAFDVVAIRRIRALLRQYKADIINTHSSKDSWCGGLAAKLSTGTKVIRTRHLSIPIKRSFESKLLYRTLPDAVVTTGEAIREHIIEQVGLPSYRVVSIPTGIDLSKFNPLSADGAKIRAELSIPSDAPLIGTVGMLRTMKGYPYFIEAAAQVLKKIPTARFLIVGDVAFASDIKQQLSSQIASLGIGNNILMIGYRGDIPDILAALDIFVLASVKNEGVPQVISQAMAMKKPIVATDVGGISEQVVNGEVGYLVEKANATQLARAILALLENPNQAKLMGERARIRAEEKFSLQGMLDATEALYDFLLGSS